MPWVGVVQVRHAVVNNSLIWSTRNWILTRGWPWRDGLAILFGHSAMHARMELAGCNAYAWLSVIRSCGSFTLSPPPNDQARERSSRRPSSSLASSLRSQTISYYYRRRPNNVQFPNSLADLVAVDLMHGVVFSSLHQLFHAWRVPSSFIGTAISAYYRSFYWN